MFGLLGRSEVDRNDGESGKVKNANHNEDSAPEGYVSDWSARPRRNSRKSRNSSLSVSLCFVVLY